MTVSYLLMDTTIDSEKVHTFINWTTTKINEGTTEICVAFSTSGGNVTAGIMMSNYIRAMPVAVTMHNISIVGSIGIPIYAAATRRRSNPLSRFVFHGAGHHSGDRLDEMRLTELLETTKSSNDLIARSIAETAGMNFDECRKLLTGESSRSTEWAVEHGICQEIVEFKIPPEAMLINLF